ncbi:Cytokinin dehydrogenase 5 [Vitis vinifera]|uniref:Cytokinin dehydrogenase 5 n=1 Tax=Vitis vinifera TaxID=29760 RepID=A0A438FD89_VITVI|nr:Cytokinin dehydrogenase 5 [Vitis vinifera]
MWGKETSRCSWSGLVERVIFIVIVDIQELLKGLNFLPGFVFTKDVPLVDFISCLSGELDLRAKGLRDVPHPWPNLFVSRSRI